MKKAVGITAGVVVIAAAGWLGTTWHTGTRIQDEAPARLAQINKELATALSGTGFGATISQLSYDRHFFSSDVRYAVKLNAIEGGESVPNDVLEVEANIEHGPFTKGAIASGHWMPKLAFVRSQIASNELTKPVFELTKGVSPLSSEVVIAYNGDSEGTATIAPFDFAKDEQFVKFSGLSVEGSFERATRHIVGTIKSDLLSFKFEEPDENVKFDVQGIYMDVNSYAGKTGMDIGTSSIKIDTITADIQPMQEGDSGKPEAIPGAGSKFVLKDQFYSAKISEQGDNLNYQTDYKIGQVLVNGNDYGKGYATLTLDKIDSKSAQALADLYNEILSETTSATNTGTPSDARLIEAANQLNKLLAANPTLRLDPFVWETPQGKSNVTLAIDLMKPSSLTADFDLNNYEQLIQESIKLIDLKVSISKPMVQGLFVQYLQQSGVTAEAAKEEATEQVDSMASLAEMFGVAKATETSLVGTFRYADKKAELNGEEIPVEDLFNNLLGELGSDDDFDMDEEPGTILTGLDPSAIGDILDEAGYAYELDISTGEAFLTVDATEDGVDDFTIVFNECDGVVDCSDLMMRVDVGTEHAVPMWVFNDWNKENRLMRAYWDDENQTSVMEMDINAYGGIGQSNVEYQISSFIEYIPLFVETMQSAPKK